MEVTINTKIHLTKPQYNFLKKITFKADATNGGYYFAQVWLKNNEEQIADALCQKGILRYSVTSWGYQEHDYYLTDFGKQFLINYLNFDIPN